MNTTAFLMMNVVSKSAVYQTWHRAWALGCQAQASSRSVDVLAKALTCARAWAAFRVRSSSPCSALFSLLRKVLSSISLAGGGRSSCANLRPFATAAAACAAAPAPAALCAVVWAAAAAAAVGTPPAGAALSAEDFLWPRLAQCRIVLGGLRTSCNIIDQYKYVLSLLCFYCVMRSTRKR